MTMKKAKSTDFAFLSYTRLPLSGVVNNNKWGVFQKKKPKYILRFLNKTNGKKHNTTDYNLRLNKRNRKLQAFNDFFEPYFMKNEISILCFVVYANSYPSISDFIDYQKKTKLLKKDVSSGSHIWICDIGSKRKRHHYHLFIVIDHISSDTFKSIYGNNNEKKFKVTLMDKRFGLFIYCKKKELFGKYKGKCCGGSNTLFLPIKKAKLTRNNTSKAIKII